MKKILSLAVLLMTALTGFTSCTNDDKEDATLALVKTSWDYGNINDEIDLGGDLWIIKSSRHFSFYDDHTGMFICEGTNTYPAQPEFNDKFTNMTQFTYTFDGTSGTITLGRITIVSDDPDMCCTGEASDSDPHYTFTLNPDGKSIHLTVISKYGTSETDIPKLAKFDEVKWVEFPPVNSWGGKIDPKYVVYFDYDAKEKEDDGDGN